MVQAYAAFLSGDDDLKEQLDEEMLSSFKVNTSFLLFSHAFGLMFVLYFTVTFHFTVTVKLNCEAK